jgi:hypothetical protein
VVSDPALAPLCDKTIADDAVRKLQLGADFSQRTGRPWFEPGVSILRAVHATAIYLCHACSCHEIL